MIAVYTLTTAYAIAVICAAGRLYLLGCAHALRKAVAAAYQRPPSTPLRIPAQSLSPPTVQAPNPVLQWPRDN